MRRVISNDNIDEVDESDFGEGDLERILRNNKNTRRRFIAGLEIPTYGNFKLVYFYDVLQMMTQLVVSFHYDKEKISETKMKLNAIARLKSLEGSLLPRNSMAG